ncbi:MAG: hypothetical protein AAFV86_18065, partial [Pseudomonadota bacterium]
MFVAKTAYRLAEDLIDQARHEGWRYLNLSSRELEQGHRGERRAGDKRLRPLTALPPAIADCQSLER